jgi:small subunit ribosomal protein S1
MTNELTQDAEESITTEKTAIDQSETATATAEALAPQQEAASTPVTPEAPATDQTEEPSNHAAESVVDADVSASEPGGSVEAPQASPAPEQPARPTPTEPRRVTIPRSAAPKPQAPVQTQAPPPAQSPAQPQARQQVVEDSSADIDFGAILEQFEQEQTVFHPGELVDGTVVGISDRGILVDFGYKSEGLVPVEEFTGPNGEINVTVGQKVEVVIRSMHSADSAPQLSHTDALGRKVWDEIETAFQAETPVIGRIVDKTKGGLRVEINGIEAFLPGSQIDSRPIRSLDSYIGQDIEAKIIKFSRRRNNIVLSRKVLTDEVVNAEKAATLSKIDIGYVVEGTIKNLTEYGAFVDIGGIDGLLHVTDMSWGRIHHPADQFKVGDHIQVKVLKLDREREKVSLGYKQLLPDPWSTVVEVYPVNTKITGTVSSVTEYGVFVELEPGVEGLVHVSEVSWSRRSPSPKRMFHKGQEVEVQVLGVDTVEKRISLGMKQFLENPWDRVHERYPVGSKVHGRVRNLTDFGAFIELEEGIDGLVHVSDISWAKKIKHPKDVLKKDQEVDAIVTSIDRNGQRLSLSMKDLTPSAWEGFVATHRPGDVVRGKVSRFTNFGVFVELGEGLEGLCHISELSDERVERPEDIAQLGQEMDFKILRIEPSEQKIGLSHRSIGKSEDAAQDTKMYSSEAKGGMASLGELANLRLGGAAPEPAAEEDPEEKKRQKKAAKKAKAEEFAAREAEAQKAAEEAPEVSEETVSDEAHADASDQAVSEEVPAEVPDETLADESTAAHEETVAEETLAENGSEDADTAEAPAGETPAEESASDDRLDQEPVIAEDASAEIPAAEVPAEVAPAEETSAVEETPKEESETAPVAEASTAASEVPSNDIVAAEEPIAEAGAVEADGDKETSAEEPPADEAAKEEQSSEEESADGIVSAEPDQAPSSETISVEGSAADADAEGAETKSAAE